jgi:hypothetical protein
MFGILQCKELIGSGRRYSDSKDEYEIDGLMRKLANFEALRAHNLLDYVFLEEV